MHYYLQVGTEASGPLGAVLDAWQGVDPLPTSLTDVFCFLEIPNNLPSQFRGYRYLGEVTLGIIVLGEDFETLLEAPPAPGCSWDGQEWVCPGKPEEESPKGEVAQ